MNSMANPNQILDVFTKYESRERIELMVLMCRLLTPTELRFVLTHLEDLAANSLRTYQKVEFEANDCKRLSSIAKPEATLDEIVGQAVLFTSFLKKDNINGARLMSRILEDIMRRVEVIGSSASNAELGSKENSDRTAELEVPLIGDVLLLFSMASHHSAFSFNSRLRLHEYLQRLQSLFDQPDLRLCTEQSIAGSSSIFSSLESVELASDGGAFPTTSLSNNQNGASSESSENNLNANAEKVSGVSIPYHVMVSPRNSDMSQESPQSKRTVVPGAASTSSDTSSHIDEVQSHDGAKESSGHSNTEVVKGSSASRRSSSRISSIDSKTLEEASCISRPNDSNNSDEKAMHSEWHNGQSWLNSLPSKSSSCVSNPQSPVEPVVKPQMSALLDKLINGNILNDVDIEFAKEKRRSLGGNANQKPLLNICARPVQNEVVTNSSTPIKDHSAKNAPLDSSVIESSSRDVNDLCDVSQVESELSQSFLPDLLDFKDDAASVKQAPDRRSSMPPYLPSSLLPMFKREAEEKLSGEEEDDKQNCIDVNAMDKNSELGNTERGFLQDTAESPAETSSMEVSTSSGRSYRNHGGGRSAYGYSRSRNGNHSLNMGSHRGPTDHSKMNGISGYDSGGYTGRSFGYRSNNGSGRSGIGHAEHKSSRQINQNFNANSGHFQQHRQSQMNSGMLQLHAQSKATFHQQYHQTFLNNQPQLQSHVHGNHQQQPQQQHPQSSKSTGSPPGAFNNVQHLNVATSVTQPPQGFYHTHYLAPYPAEFAQAVFNPAYYGYRAQATMINRTSNNSIYQNNATRFHTTTIPRGVTPSFYSIPSAQLVMAAFQPTGGIQQFVCQEQQVPAQSPQTCFFDPSVPPPPLANPPSVATYAPQVVLYDRGSTIDSSGKLMCPNCASNDHSFNNCPHSLPPIPR